MSNPKDYKHILEDLKSYENDVAACNRCGFCTSYCPTYNATGSESHSPRGRNQTFRSLLEGKLDNPEEAKEIIDTCILCGECTSVCFSEVPTAHLMVQARNLINHAEGTSWGLRLIINKVLPNPRLMYILAKISFLGKMLGLAWLLRKSGLLAKISPTLANADAALGRVSLTFLSDLKEAKPRLLAKRSEQNHAYHLAQEKVKKLRELAKPVPPSLKKLAEQQPPQKPKVALLPVCGSQYLRSSIARSTIQLLEKVKVDFVIPELGCCGLPAASYGVVEQVSQMADANMKTLESGRFEALVADDSSCTAHIKDYPLYFKNSPAKSTRAQSLVKKVTELSSYLIEKGMIDLLKKSKWSGGPVAYHDPCKAQYGQKITQPPRLLLEAIPGLTLVPIADSDQCCGGGGTYSFVHPELAGDIQAKKIKNILNTQCKVVVTSSASCMLQLQAGLKDHPQVQVMHISEFLADVI